MNRLRINTKREGRGIFAMWLNLTLSVASIILVLLASKIVSPEILPVVTLVLSLGLYASVRYNRASAQSVCYLLPFVTSCSLFVSALVMIFINMLHRRHYIDLLVGDIELLNPNIPYIPVLIVTTVTSLMLLWSTIRGKNFTFCKDCIRQFGTAAERGTVGQYYAQEGRYHIKMMLGLMVGIGLVDWIYYIFYYSNIDFISPDAFFFVVGPVIMLLAAIVFATVRSLSMWHYHFLRVQQGGTGKVTKLRYLIICGDEMLLKVPDIDVDTDFTNLFIDTPAQLTLRRNETIDEEQAQEHFANITNIAPTRMRYLYHNMASTADTAIYHYLVELPSKELPADARIDGDWFTMANIDNMSVEDTLSPMLVSELHRLHTMTMAWKVYDEDGLRRYKIRNYKPLFRLSDLFNPDIDFNNYRKWLYIAANNEDTPFFRLRRFWGRYISGTASRK